MDEEISYFWDWDGMGREGKGRKLVLEILDSGERGLPVMNGERKKIEGST
jgi:hypothetical protein